jgi:hypothetical protein
VVLFIVILSCAISTSLKYYDCEVIDFDYGNGILVIFLVIHPECPPPHYSKYYVRLALNNQADASAYSVPEAYPSAEL